MIKFVLSNIPKKNKFTKLNNYEIKYVKRVGKNKMVKNKHSFIYAVDCSCIWLMFQE